MKKQSKKKMTKSEAASKRNSTNSRFRRLNAARLKKRQWEKENKDGVQIWDNDNETALGMYLEEIGKFPRLKRAEEQKLFTDFIKWRDTRALKNGCNGRVRRIGREAREKLITSNLLLVVKIAGDYSKCGVPLDDLISEGNIGLMRAVDKFQLGKGTKLSTYAAFWIRQSILRLLARDARVIALPENARDAYYRILTFKNEFKDEHGHEPTREQIAKGAKCSVNMVENVFESGVMNICSLQEPASRNHSTVSDSPPDLEAMIPDDSESPSDQYEFSEDIEVLEKFLSQLTRREKQILIYRFGLDNKESETLEKIGERHGLTRERIRQIQFIALAKLKGLSNQCYGYDDNPLRKK